MFLDDDRIHPNFSDCFEESGGVGGVGAVGGDDFDALGVDAGGVRGRNCDSVCGCLLR